MKAIIKYYHGTLKKKDLRFDWARANIYPCAESRYHGQVGTSIIVHVIVCVSVRGPEERGPLLFLHFVNVPEEGVQWLPAVFVVKLIRRNIGASDVCGKPSFNLQVHRVYVTHESLKLL